MLEGDQESSERLVDELIDDHQLERGGLIGGLRHIEDGDVPQTVEASVAGLNSVACEPASEPRSTLESWVLGDWVDGDTAPLGKAGLQAAGGSTAGLSPELRALAEGLLRLIGPTQETAVQTGGVKDAGRVVRGGPQGRVAKP